MSSSNKRGCKQEEEDIGLRKGPWTLEEDSLLIHYIACHGEGRWNLVARSSGLKRTGKSCRLRWLNYLKPDVKRGNLTPEEQLVILELHSKWGNRWSKIAQQLPGRTDNEIKNYWRTRVQKQARQLKIDANSARFRDMIRLFWMPRLLHKMASSSNQSLNPASTLINLAPQSSPSPPESLSTSTEQNTVTSSYCSYKSFSEDCSPCNSSNSINITQLPLISSLSTSAEDLGNFDNAPFLKDCYDNNSYDLEALHDLASTSTPGFSYSVFEFPPAQNVTCADEMVDCLWNMDELWHFIKPQGWSII